MRERENEREREKEREMGRETKVGDLERMAANKIG
jgi:hypothetical protein